MASLNKVILIGHVGRDAELTFTPTGKPKLVFSLATNNNYKDKDGQWQKETDWHRIVAWGPMALTRQDHVKRGKQVYVEGRIQTRKYNDKEGAERSITEVKAWRLLMLGKADAEPHHVEAEAEAEEEASPF